MRVLLLHEMSGVHTELRLGLRKLGVDAQLATFGDGWKRFKSDIDLGVVQPTLRSHLGRIAKQVGGIAKFRSFDVIQVVSPKPFYSPLSPILERLVFSGDRTLVYLAAGSDAIYRKHVTSLAYHPPHDWYERPKEYSDLIKMIAPFNAIVPVCWEYKYAMERAGLKPAAIMPFPIDVSSRRVHRLGRSGKLKFFHPLNRDNYLAHDFKGTRLIKQAFHELEQRFGQVAEFFCAGGMSHVEYDKLTDEVDVIVDQAYSYTYGMSAAYGLAKGKVVLSGLEDIARSGFYTQCPVLNIKPDVDHIKLQIESVISNAAHIQQLSEQSRSFAEENHDHVRVAQQYLRLYE